MAPARPSPRYPTPRVRAAPFDPALVLEAGGAVEIPFPVVLVAVDVVTGLVALLVILMVLMTLMLVLLLLLGTGTDEIRVVVNVALG